jgi:transcription elongation factor GreB
MSKVFTKEGNGEEEDFDEPNPVPAGIKNLMTPVGHAALEKELKFLTREERPRIVEIVSWAAGNGDRSENGDYIYNKKRLREIDRRLRYLTKRLEDAEIVDPRRQQGLEQVFFGATVTYAKEDNSEITVQLVGVDEADLDKGKINWLSPVAKALMKLRVGDRAVVNIGENKETVEVIMITYKLS